MKVFILAIVCFSVLISTTIIANRAEWVAVLKVKDYTVIIKRRNGEVWIIEHGTGCISMPRQEGKAVIVSSPGTFGGSGSKFIIPDNEQECRIWTADPVE